jgi:hypothetical protein
MTSMPCIGLVSVSWWKSLMLTQRHRLLSRITPAYRCPILIADAFPPSFNSTCIGAYLSHTRDLVREPNATSKTCFSSLGGNLERLTWVTNARRTLCILLVS